MDTIKENGKFVEEPKRKLPSRAKSGDLGISLSQKNMLTEDPAFFLIAHLILVARYDSITSLKNTLKENPVLSHLVDRIVFELDSKNLIEVKGDVISHPLGSISLANDPDNLKKFLPRMFEIASDRLIENACNGRIKQNNESLYYFVLPESKEVAESVKAIYAEFKYKMMALAHQHDSTSSEKIRFVGFENCILEPKDFV